MSSTELVDRVFRNLPKVTDRFAFEAWKHGDKPTKEGVGVLPVEVDVDALAARVMDVDHYVGNVEHVEACRSIDAAETDPPRKVRFYQRIEVPMLGKVHHELVMEDLGERDGWRVLAWNLHPDTDALDTKAGARSAYNEGAWLIRGDVVAYALSSAPRKSDLGRLKYAALTKGADVAASKVVQANIEGMVRWSKR